MGDGYSVERWECTKRYQTLPRYPLALLADYGLPILQIFKNGSTTWIMTRESSPTTSIFSRWYRAESMFPHYTWQLVIPVE